MSQPLHLEVARARARESARLTATAGVPPAPEPRFDGVPWFAFWRERRGERDRSG